MMRWNRAWVAVVAAVCLLPGAAAVAAQGRSATIRVRETLTTDNVRTEESSLANVVADSIRASAKAEVGLIAATSFATVTIGAGEAATQDFTRALVFRGDTVVLMRLSGSQIKTALEHGLGLYPAKSAAFLQVSGISFEVNASAPKGSRVVNLKVGKAPLVPDRVYTTAMPSPLAGGALVYSKAWSKADLERETGITLDQALADYLSTLTEISGKGDGRIVVRK